MNKENRTTNAGNKGDKVRSDCYASFEIKDQGGLQIEITSKVKSIYGQSIRKLCEQVLAFFEIKHANLKLEDQGALPYVIAARIEAAIKQSISTTKSFLFPIITENQYTTEKERFRFSRLYLPGNSPSLILNAGIHKSNGIILDLEDSVAADKKDEARLLVRNALCVVDFYGAERMVRINQGDLGLKDLQAIIPCNVNLVLIPKCETVEHITIVENEIKRISEIHNLTAPVFLMPIIESALGVENAFKIAESSKNIVAMAIGLEDLTADLGVKRTKEGTETFFARTRLVNACKAAAIQPIDSVFSDVGDMAALTENVRISKSLGFEGMGCIHPRQIKVIHDGYAPDADEIDKARKIIAAYEDAKSKGLGVVSLGTKMIDLPVVKRAEKTIHLAILLGLLEPNWLQTSI